MARIMRQNFSECVADSIREKILNIDIEPGTRLIVEELASSLDVSRTPVREGLRNLAMEGLIIYDGKSYFVRKHNLQEIEDLFIIRRSLELTSVRQAAERRDASDITAMKELCTEAENYVSTNNLNLFISYDKRFHGSVAVASKNERLQNMLKQLNDECWWINKYIFMKKPLMYPSASTLQAHCDIVYLIEQQKPEAAVARMERHIIEGEKRKFKTLSESEPVSATS